MFVNKKVLAAAIVGALVAGNAAAANLSAPTGAIPAYFAKEIIATPAAPATLNTSAAAALTWNIGYNFSDGEVRYVRLECSDNIEFDAATAIAPIANGNVGAINGLGTNVLTFSITSAAPNVVDTAVVTVVGNHDITGTDSNVNCEVALYDQPSQAQAGGAAGRIANTHFSGAYLAFAPSYELVANATTHVSDVEAVPSFSSFDVDAFTTTATASMGNGGSATAIALRVRDPDGPTGVQTATFDIAGNPMTLATLLGAATDIVVSGDFSAAASAGTTPYNAAALARVQLNGANADDLSATEAVFNVGAAGFVAADFDFTRRAGNLIPASEYVAMVDAASAAPAVYRVADITGVKFGEIVRNGTELQAPLVNVPDGWISRLVLTNTSNADRPYSIAVQGEHGNTITTDNLTGTIGANETLVIEDLKDVLTGFTGLPRATLNVSVAGPNAAIQGLYQIVNPDSGSISNHVLVRPGTN